MAFRGNYDHTLDAKNRLTIPAKFRAALDGGVVLAQALEPCVAIWTPDAFEQFTDSFLKDLNPLSQEARRLSRFFNAGSFDGELDTAGRVMLSQPLLTYAGLTKDVVVIGNNDHLELWDPKAWRVYEDDLTANLPDTVASIVDAA
ncbi:MAG: division/cell wall cluster transcriptional repressor MraZ [Solirubrobacterales bacterium]